MVIPVIGDDDSSNHRYQRLHNTCNLKFETASTGAKAILKVSRMNARDCTGFSRKIEIIWLHVSVIPGKSAASLESSPSTSLYLDTATLSEGVWKRCTEIELENSVLSYLSLSFFLSHREGEETADVFFVLEKPDEYSGDDKYVAPEAHKST